MSSSSPARPPTENQLSSNPGVHVQVTTHNEQGKAVVKSTTPVKVCIYPEGPKSFPRLPRASLTPPADRLTTRQWVRYDDDKLVMSVLYTTQFPPDLNDEADVKVHESRVAKGPEATGLALKGGTVLRYVEFSPGYTVCLGPARPQRSESHVLDSPYPCPRRKSANQTPLAEPNISSSDAFPTY